MSNQIDREGTFKGKPVRWGIRTETSGAVAANIEFEITDEYGDGEWADWTKYDMVAFGNFYIIKKDGTINNKCAESLVESLGWDGKLDTIANPEWTPKNCQIVVKAETYQGTTRHKVAFVNPIDFSPSGSIGNTTPDQLKALNTRYGSQLRALVGPVNHGGNKPTGKPSSPPPSNKKAQTVPVGGNHEEVSEDDIPF